MGRLLCNHPDAEQYSKNAVSISKLQDHYVDLSESLGKMEDSPTLVVISRDPIDGYVQAVFHLFAMGNQILKKSIKFGALMGFSKRATPVRVDPKSLFYYSSQDRPVPPFSKLLKVSSTEVVEEMTVSVH